MSLKPSQIDQSGYATNLLGREVVNSRLAHKSTFEVVSMDFIPELPRSDGFNNIFVIVDKLAKYVVFIPTTTTISEKETAELFFHHIILKFGVPQQVISDRDTR